MAGTGTIVQFKGPFNSSSFSLGGKCKIGISMSEEDFMEASDPSRGDGFYFNLNNTSIIYMGKTQIYETENYIENPIIQFPQTAPSSLIINCVYG